MRSVCASDSRSSASPIQCIDSLGHYVISYIPNGELVLHRDNIEHELRTEFSGVEFMDNTLSVDKIIDECLDQPPVQADDCIIHIVAFSKNNEANIILGALFDIPTVNYYGRDASDTGWFFTSSKLNKSSRAVLANDLWNNAFTLIKRAGYNKIKTTIGTKSGKNYLEKTHGFYNAPEVGYQFWIKDL
jgi:hypothetical protein